MAPTKYTVNGREYNSLDEMPPDDRAVMERHMKMLADRNGDGVPDLFAGLKGGRRAETQVLRTWAQDGSNVDVDKLMQTVSRVLGDAGAGGQQAETSRWQVHDRTSTTTTGAASTTGDRWRLVIMLAAIAAVAVYLVWWFG